MIESGFTQKREHVVENPMRNIERGENDPLTKASDQLIGVFNIPSGAFSGIATYRDKEGREIRISPKLDKAMAEHFTNVRYIVKEINGIGPITSKDPREGLEIVNGNIDAVIEEIEKMMNTFKKMIRDA